MIGDVPEHIHLYSLGYVRCGQQWIHGRIRKPWVKTGIATIHSDVCRVFVIGVYSYRHCNAYCNEHRAWRFWVTLGLLHCFLYCFSRDMTLKYITSLLHTTCLIMVLAPCTYVVHSQNPGMSLQQCALCGAAEVALLMIV